ncbi:hypothetical protein [Streptomyces sp. NPDC001100]
MCPNCAGTDNGTYAVSYTYSTNSSYSYENSQRLEVSAGFSDELQAGIKASTSSSETWTLGTTRTATATITIRPGCAGAYWFAPYVRHSQGWAEVHYNKRQFGHRDWFYPYRGSSGVRIDTPAAWSDGSLKDQVYWATWKCE